MLRRFRGRLGGRESLPPRDQGCLLYTSLYPNAATGFVWPPKGIHPFNPWEIPFLNTLILLCSGTTATWAHHALIENDRKNLIRGLLVTVMLGVSFTSLQAYEYSHAAFGFKDGIRCV